MEGHFGLILAVAAVTYATRIGGLSLGGRTVPPQVRRFLAYVPIAVFAALVAPGVGGVHDELSARLVGAFVAAVAVLLWRRLWTGLACGMAGYWLVRVLIGWS